MNEWECCLSDEEREEEWVGEKIEGVYELYRERGKGYRKKVKERGSLRE